MVRKLPLSGGATVRGYIDELRGIVARVQETNDPAFGATAVRLSGAVESLARATEWLLKQLGENGGEAALAGATPYLRLFGTAAGGCALADEALSAQRLEDGDAAQRIGLARFFAENVAVLAGGLETTVTEGAASVAPLSDAA